MATEIIEANIKSNIGDVAKGIDKASDATGKLAKETGQLEKATKKGAKGFKGVGMAVKGVGMALKAAGIGLVVALLAKLMEVFSKNQKVLDFFKVGMNALSIAFNDLFGFISNNVGKVTGFFKNIFENPQESLKKFGKAIKDNLIERFNSLLETFGHVGKAIGHLVKGQFAEAWESAKDAGREMVDVYTGVDDSLNKIVNTVKNGVAAVKEYATETIGQATSLMEAEKAANRAGAEFAKLNAQYLKEAELLRQVRDDVTKTFAERIQANEDLNEVLAKQQALQKEQLQTQINYAQAQYNINASEENWIALQEAKNGLLELEEAITGQLSEQKTNAVGLAQELIDAERELALVGKTARELELAELEQNYEIKVDLARKAGQKIAAIEAEFAAQKKEINDTYDAEAAEVEAAAVEAQIAADEEEAAALEVEREAELARAQEIADAKAEIAYAMVQAIADNLFQSLDEELERIESKNESETEANNTKYDNQIAAAKAAGKDTIKLEKLKEAEQKKIDKATETERIKNAKKQKKLQVAMATIETFKSAVAAFSSLAPIPIVGPVLGGIAAAAAVVAGLANIRKILKQDVGGGGGGGGGSETAAASTAAATTAAPPAPEMMSGKFSLGGGEAPEPVKAYVVADEMTNKQDQLDEIRRESTL
jgi:hypothetical protein